MTDYEFGMVLFTCVVWVAGYFCGGWAGFVIGMEKKRRDIERAKARKRRQRERKRALPIWTHARFMLEVIK